MVIVLKQILADWCLFTTLFRFDLAYYGLFKCNLKRLVEYPNLWHYFRDLYQQPGVKEMCSADHVKQLYYAGLLELNPNRVIPKGPAIDFDLPHDHDRHFDGDRPLHTHPCHFLRTENLDSKASGLRHSATS